MRKLLLAVLALMVLGTTAAFAAGAQEEAAAAPVEDQTLRLGYEPQDGVFGYPWWHPGFSNRILYKRLLNTDQGLRPVYPSMAEEWSISDDGLTVVLKIRDDMKWHDGEPITVEDVRWSIETVLFGTRIQGTIKDSFTKIEGAQDFIDGNTERLRGVTVSGNTITIKLASATAFMDFALSQFAPLPKHLLQDEDPARLHLSEHWTWPIGSGPFKIVERQPGDYTVLEAFEDYFLGTPKIPRVVFRYWSDPVAAAETRQLDLTNVMDTSQATQIMQMPHMKVTPSDIGYTRFFWFKMDEKPFDDVRVRKALTLAIDRQSLVDDLFDGYGDVLSTVIQPAWEKEGLEPLPYDPQEARRLLDAANWPADRVVKLSYYYTDEISKDLIATVQYYWEQVGVKSEPHLMAGNVVELLYESRDFDVCYVGLSSPEPNDATARYTTGSPLNAIRYENPEYDRLIQQSTTTVGYENRKPIVDRIQEILYEDIPMMPLFTLYNFWVESERLQRPTDVYSNAWFESKLDWHEWELGDW